ncbi:response regulator [Methylococcus sp. ANG]|uniref:response regulator transcription factor n=1 Tax=Methylococcus sp. ANG TaxID=3231903 RepID=UPI0034583CC2
MLRADSTVFVVDDDAAVLKAVERLLRAEGLEVAAFRSPREFLDCHDPGVPGCLVLDLSMPDLDGLALQRALAERGEARPTVFLSGHGDIPASVRAMKQGAVDFLTKPVNDADLLEAVRQAIARDLGARAKDTEMADLRSRLATLTPRELEVLGHVVAGRLNKQIAADLGTVEKTVKVHRARIMQKLRASSVAELVRIAVRAGAATAPDR